MQSLVKLLSVRNREKHEISLSEKVNQRVSVYHIQMAKLRVNSCKMINATFRMNLSDVNDR